MKINILPDVQEYLMREVYIKKKKMVIKDKGVKNLQVCEVSLSVLPILLHDSDFSNVFQRCRCSIDKIGDILRQCGET